MFQNFVAQIFFLNEDYDFENIDYEII